MNISNKKLFEERKQLFNAYQKPNLSKGGLDWRMKKLIHKSSTDNPDSLTSEVRRLVAKRFQNSQEWIKEQEEKEKVEQEELKKLTSDWDKD